jgi:hypothetical protein
LELREFNKDLKNRFIEIERQVNDFMNEEKVREENEKENAFKHQ